MEENNIQKPFAISQKLLLKVYLIIPVILSLIACDTFFFGGYLKNLLTINTANALIYVFFLDFPHIIASFVGYADTEYVRFYRKKLFISLPILLAVTAGVIYVSPAVAGLFYLAYNMYHAIKQQTGIAGILVGTRSKMFEIWAGTAVVGAMLSNFYVFTPELTQGIVVINSLLSLHFFVILLVVMTVLYLAVLKKGTIGWWYVLATSVMLVTSYLCVVMGYLFFAVLLVRFAHDATAFIFYTVHDSNRNVVTAKNIFYMLLKPLHLPVIIITPILGISLAYALRTYGVASEYGFYVVILVAVSHYYIESFMWKRESLHRKQLRFVP